MPPKGRKKTGAGTGRDWGHPEGMALADIDLNAAYGGVITNVSPYGVFVDFGAVRDGLMRVPTVVGRSFKKGMTVTGLTVIECDPEANRVVLQPDDTTLPQAQARRQRPASSAPAVGRQREDLAGGGKGGGARQRATSRPVTRERPGNENGTPLEELEEGSFVTGTVTNVSPAGVFVDIGAVRDARLNVPVKIGRRFSIGDVVNDCRLEVVDLDLQRLGLTFDDPEEAVRDLPPKDRGAAKAKAKSRGTPPAPAARGGGNETRDAVTKAAEYDLADLEVGAIVDGVVANKSQFGVFVDIGCGKDARLQVPRSVGQRFRRGEELFGLRVEALDVERRRIDVVLEDSEEQEDYAEEKGAEEEEEEGEEREQSAKPPLRQRREEKEEEDEEPEQSAQAPPRQKKEAAAKGKTGPAARAKQGSATTTTKRQGKKVDRFKVGGAADGTVTKVGPQGVFVDIGATQDGLLKLPRQIANQFRVGDEVHGMTVESLDRQADRVLLLLEDPLLQEVGEASPPPPRGTAAKGEVKARGKAKARAEPVATASAKAAAVAAKTSAAPTAGGGSGARRSPPQKAEAPPAGTKGRTTAKDWGHKDGAPLDEFAVGEEVSGIVTNCSNYGVFLDFGAVKDGRLRVSKEDARKFRKGDQVDGMVIEEIDLDMEKTTLGLTFEMPDEPAVYEDYPPTRGSQSGSERRQAASGQQRQQQQQPQQQPRRSSGSPQRSPRANTGGTGGGSRAARSGGGGAGGGARAKAGGR